MSHIIQISGLAMSINSGSEDNAFHSAMRNYTHPVIWQISESFGGEMKGATDVTLSIIDSLPIPKTETVTVSSSNIITVSGLGLENSGYEIYFTIDSEQSWIFGADAGNTSILIQVNLSGMYTLGELQSALRVHHPSITLSVAGEDLIIENLPHGTYQLEISETEGAHLSTHLATGGNTTTSTQDIPHLSLSVEKVQYGYRVSHPEIYGGSSEELASKMYADNTRSRFPNLADFAIQLSKGNAVYDALEAEMKAPIKGVVIDQKNSILYVANTAAEHGELNMAIIIGKDSKVDFGE